MSTPCSADENLNEYSPPQSLIDGKMPESANFGAHLPRLLTRMDTPDQSKLMLQAVVKSMNKPSHHFTDSEMKEISTSMQKANVSSDSRPKQNPREVMNFRWEMSCL